MFIECVSTSNIAKTEKLSAIESPTNKRVKSLLLFYLTGRVGFWQRQGYGGVHGGGGGGSCRRDGSSEDSSFLHVVFLLCYNKICNPEVLADN